MSISDFPVPDPEGKGSEDGPRSDQPTDEPFDATAEAPPIAPFPQEPGPGQQWGGAPYQGQQAAGPQPYPGQQWEGQQAYPGQQWEGQQAYPGQQWPGQQAYPGQQWPGQQAYHGQQWPGQPDPSAPYGRHPVTGEPYSDKQKIVAGLLQLFLGGFGAGRFYLGDTGIALAQLFTCGGLGIWALIDAIMILMGNVRDKQGRPLRD